MPEESLSGGQRADRLALATLDAPRLRELLDDAGLAVADKRSRDQILDALCSDRGPAWGAILATCSRDELKAMCRATGRSEDGREKSGLVARLLESLPTSEGEPGGDIEGAWRLRVLQLLTRDELRELVDEQEIDSVDRRNAAVMAETLAQLALSLEELLDALSRTRLKELCRVLGLDDGGREKAPLLARIVSNGGKFGPSERIAYAPELTAGLLAELMGPAFEIEARSNLWPAKTTFRAGDAVFPLTLYGRRIGPSRTPQERRFQNPAGHHPIVVHPEATAVLVGLWLENGPEHPVLVAFDAYRREGSTTRFSLFTPLSLLESAADSGYATHVSSSGEAIYAFRPEKFGQYLDELLERRRHEEAPAPKVKTMNQTAAQAVAAPVAHDMVEIRPKAGMFAAFARLNYKPWFALAELVDNAVQSFLANQDRLEKLTSGPLLVDITLEEGELRVLDRAGGIPLSEFGRAFSPAAPPSDTSGLSEFGLGMKAAASWFAHEWSVRTKAIGDPWERTVTFDVAAITKQGLDQLPIDRREAKAEDHYTELRMRRLRQQPRANTITKMKEHLASIYRLLIEDGTLHLRFTSSNGRVDDLRYDAPKLLTAPPWNAPNASPLLWRREINLEHNDKRITGWAGLLENGKYARAGFAVFRRQRLIEGSVGEAYRPHLIFGAPNSFVSQRLVGELYVEGFDVTHTKDGIQWGAEEEDILHDLKQQLDTNELPLIRQAQNYRARNLASKLIPSFGGEALEAVSDALSSVEMSEAMSRTPSTPEDPYASVSLAPDPQGEQVMQLRRFRMQIQAGKVWNVSVQTVRDPAARWLNMTTESDDAGAPTVVISVNLDHPFSEEHINGNEEVLQPIMHLAACLGIAEQQARLQGVRNSSQMRSNLNEMLRGGAAYTDLLGDEE